MTRPFKCRKIGATPRAYYFKPRAVPLCELEEVVLQLDEFEALRLEDLEGMDQEKAAARMEVSRQTFGNILASARKKTADAIVHGKALNIKGGMIKMEERGFTCAACGNSFAAAYGVPRPEKCPRCGSADMHREKPEPVRPGRGAGHRRGRCRGRSQ